ncbi:MAG: ECF transporter S component [Oscillospiraceae bacterium]|jgi:riboflavin transporter FmnP|nr:ECF transporter S component [Oscillospiraceae bacterium]
MSTANHQTVPSAVRPAARRSRKIAVTAMLSAAATVLMALDFPIPFLIPPFVKMDFSELPALLAAFSLGPVWGAAVCLVKNLINLTMSSTNGVGELCNFLLGVCFVIPAGVIYRHWKTRWGALAAALAGAVLMAVCSVPINYFISYPFYTTFMPIDTIIGMYQELIPSVDGLLACLIVFNAPFTLLKALLDTLLAFLIYKPLSPLLHR